jgi:hypothetical protein
VREAVSNAKSFSNASYDFQNNKSNTINHLPDMSSLQINEDYEFNNKGDDSLSNNYTSSKLRAPPVSKPTSLPDLIEENELEFPAPEPDQPIMVI